MEFFSSPAAALPSAAQTDPAAAASTAAAMMRVAMQSFMNVFWNVSGFQDASITEARRCRTRHDAG
jgi:hypothetical protein